MKDPIVQLRSGQKILWEGTLTELARLCPALDRATINATEEPKLYLNFEEVEPMEDMEL